MSITIPKAADIQELPLDEKGEVFLAEFLVVVQKYPQNRMLLFALIFCAYELGISSEQLGPWLSCTSRNVRYVLEEVRASQRGAGKTGRPPKRENDETADPEATTIGVTR